ncbi:MAG: hypothetical protein WA708_15180 [Acidobacteriaceae bacterium]
MNCEECIRNDLERHANAIVGKLGDESGMHGFRMHLQLSRPLPLRMNTENGEKSQAKRVCNRNAERKRRKNGRNHQYHHPVFLRRNHPDAPAQCRQTGPWGRAGFVQKSKSALSIIQLDSGIPHQ